MQKLFLKHLFLISLLLVLITPLGYTKKEKETVATIDVMQPAALVDQFVGLVQYPPPSPFLLDLQGLESQRQITSPAMLSPNKSWLAASQVTLLPQTYETLTQVLIAPVGPLPKLDEYIWPRVLMDYTSKQFNKNKRKKAKLTLNDVDPKPFWAMYQVAEQPKTQQIVLRAGYDEPKANLARIYQVIDWTPDGQSLLLTYREGIYHKGLYKTVPVFRNLITGETTYYRFLPKLLVDNYCQGGCSQALANDLNYDLRLYGWQRGGNNSVIIALVGFETGREAPLAFFSYDLTSGNLKRLGASLSPDTLVSYGWQVQLRGPEIDAQTGTPNYKRNLKTYEPTKTPEAPKAPRPKYKQYWQN